ncbi:NAD(P)/FAD-dependent oxidoreductase [Herbiconiux sp. A18JL235]|uniref:NAD(P)/FAD-dependent oxidoreductase n=1 Tax=Herbiconiux sp. A18JL235 TaxID=3152363 RepID=A0AB39BIC3_9MICO
MTIRHDLVIVGAGPAGLAAALAAAEAGADVLVVDEQRAPGGQIFRRTPPEFGSPSRLPAGYPWAEELLTRARADPRIRWSLGTTVFGLLRPLATEPGDDGAGDFEVYLNGGPSSGTVLARRVLIATGAYDMPVAVPGWTLPGVMMAGAVQGLLKSQRLRVADRVVLAGSHPLLVIVAAQLVASGATVTELALARSLPTLGELVRALPAVPGHVGLLLELALCLLRLKRAGVRISLGTVPLAIEGDDRVRAVRLVEADARWRPRGPERTVETDQVVFGYGFQPSAELARQAGCLMRWDSAGGGWVVRADERLATSVAGIFAAGEPTGVSGAEKARAQGALAGLEIALDLGLAVDPRALPRARRAVKRAERFAAVVRRMFAPRRADLADLATDSTEVCRCEAVTRGEVDQFLHANPHVSSVNPVKLACRTGMGPCQGRYCETTIGQLVAKARRMPVEETGAFTAHLPVKPVPLSAYAALDDDPTLPLRAEEPGGSLGA